MSSYESSPVKIQAGRKLILSGAILLSLSVLLGMVGAQLTLGQFNASQFSRNVVINGAQNPKVPGKLSFEVAEPLQTTSAEDAQLHVGVAADFSGEQPDCKMTTADGDAVKLEVPVSGEALIGDTTGNFVVLGQAFLAPGEYEALCTVEGEPTTSSASFTVGRVFGLSDLSGSFAPLLWFLAVGLVCGLMFLLGLILLIVGLVKRSKAIKAGSSTQPGVSSGPQTGSPASQGEYAQVPPARQPVQAWPGPHAPGPPEAAPSQPVPPTGPPSQPAPPQPAPSSGPLTGPPTGAPTGPPGAAPTGPPAPPGPPPTPPSPPGWTVPPSKLR
ncbi:MAG: hypothetical protein WD029_11465 [Microthrixaceae bacterium]